MSELLFPRTKDFSKLFTVTKDPRGIYFGKGADFFVGARMYVRDRKSRQDFFVVPEKKVVAKVGSSLIVPDTLYWEAVVRDDGKTLLLIKHNKIIGGRRIALVDTKTMPRRKPCSTKK